MSGKERTRAIELAIASLEKLLLAGDANDIAFSALINGAAAAWSVNYAVLLSQATFPITSEILRAISKKIAESN